MILASRMSILPGVECQKFSKIVAKAARNLTVALGGRIVVHTAQLVMRLEFACLHMLQSHSASGAEVTAAHLSLWLPSDNATPSKDTL